MTRKIQPAACMLAAVALYSAFVYAGHAASFDWSGANSALWTDPGNWTLTGGSDGDGVPDGDDDVQFPATGDYTSNVDLNGNQSCSNLTINVGRTTSFDILGAGDLLTLTGGNVTRVEQASEDTAEHAMYCDIALPAGTSTWAIAGDHHYQRPDQGLTIHGTVTTAGTILKTQRGRLSFRTTNSFGEVPVCGDGSIDIHLPIADALGTGTLTIYGGSDFYVYGASQTISNDIHVTGSGEARMVPRDNTHTYAGDATVDASVSEFLFGMSSGTAMLLDPAATVGGGGDFGCMRIGLVITSTNQLADGYFQVGQSGGDVIMDNISWSDFVAHYNQGYGTGDGQWQFGGGGFGARTAPFVISAAPGNDAGGTDTKTYFDRTLSVGAYYTTASYALGNAPVHSAVDTELSDRRVWNIGGPASGLVGTYDTNKVHRFEGNITDQVAAGTGSSRGALKLSALNAGAMTGDLVLAGTNDWTGSTYQPGLYGDKGGGNQNSINTGPGGVMLYVSSGAHIYMGFDGADSLPRGNSGSNAWLAAASRYSGDGGYVLAAKSGGETYQLPAGYKFLLGSSDNGGSPAFIGGVGAAGPSGSSANLENSAICIQAGHAPDAQNLNLLARGATEFRLGGAAGPLMFQPTYSLDDQFLDGGVGGAATAVSNSSGARTIRMNGDGTVVLDGVAYTQQDGSGDTSSQFSWQLGRGTGNTYFDGAVRETGAAVSNSTAAFPLYIYGGVLELGAGDLARDTARPPSAGEIEMFYGGGFAAHGADRRVNLNSGAVFTAGSYSSGFNHSSYPLIFGSRTANATAILENDLSLGTGTKHFAVVRGAGTVPEGRIEGQIQNTSAAFDLIALTTRNGDPIDMGALELAHTNNLSTGAITIEEGTLLVNGGIRAGTAAVTVEGGGALGGTGVVVRPVSVLAGGELAAGSLGIGPLTLQGDVTLAEGAGVEWDYNASTGDVVVVTGTLTLPTAATVTCVGSAENVRRSPILVAGTLAGAPDVDGWTLTDPPTRRTYLEVQGTTVYLVSPPAAGFVIIAE